MNRTLKIGCIADDFTGAGDIASFFKKGGLKTILINGIPHSPIDVDCDAVVIALKSRTQETSSAVSDSLAALKWLETQGCEHFYIKYCSTFDSTRTGNIGPIVDAAMEFLDDKYTILCPALPVNGRTVENGCLYVNGVPLHESHMRSHPLTPMWDCKINELMKEQGKYSCLQIDRDALYSAKDFLYSLIYEYGKTSSRFYIIPDFIEDRDGDRIVELFGDLKLLTGGSGIAESLGKKYCTGYDDGPQNSCCPGKTLLLAGSRSTATLVQIAYFINNGGRAIRIFPEDLISGRQSVDTILAELNRSPEPTLIYSSDTPENVLQNQKLGKEAISNLLEETTAAIAKEAAGNGYTKIIVAGGETSGAVTKSLGYDRYEIGVSIAPGVPVMIPVESRQTRLVLKSGNFGSQDFFIKAVELLNGQSFLCAEDIINE